MEGVWKCGKKCVGVWGKVRKDEGRGVGEGHGGVGNCIGV